MLRPAHLSQKLDQPLSTKDGGTLRSIHEACDYMTSMASIGSSAAIGWLSIVSMPVTCTLPLKQPA